MKRMLGVMLVVAAGLAIGACDKKEGGGAGGSSSAASGGGGGGGAIGVKECDDYLTKMEACVGKLDATSKGIYEGQLKTNREAWKTAASTPQGKAGLATGCKAALDAIGNIPQCK